MCEVEGILPEPLHSRKNAVVGGGAIIESTVANWADEPTHRYCRLRMLFGREARVFQASALELSKCF
jgi:hypothetical protein